MNKPTNNQTPASPDELDIYKVSDLLAKHQEEANAMLEKLTKGMDRNERAALYLGFMFSAGVNATETAGMEITRGIVDTLIKAMPVLTGEGKQRV